MKKSSIFDDDDCDDDEGDDEIKPLRSQTSKNKTSIPFKNDTKTESTANDALVSKYSAISLKYYEDRFVRLMFQSQNSRFPSTASHIRKPPIINRGYYTRVKVVETLVKQFLRHSEHSPKRQIISLGSGLDTLSYNLLSSDIYKTNLDYIEVDFPNVIQKKLQFTLKNAVLSSLVTSNQNMHEDQTSSSTTPNIDSLETVVARSYEILHGYEVGSLKLLNADLRDSVQVKAVLLESGVDPSLPTFILTECVLVYIDKESATNLLNTVSNIFCCNHISSSSSSSIESNIVKNEPCVMWVSYDMIRPDDMFGKTMLANITAAGHRIPGFIDYPTLLAQEQRFHITLVQSHNHRTNSSNKSNNSDNNGVSNDNNNDTSSSSSFCWDVVNSRTMLQAYQDLIPQSEKDRIQTLEIFDEIEEWELIMNHYSLTIAFKGKTLARDILELK